MVESGVVKLLYWKSSRSFRVTRLYRSVSGETILWVELVLGRQIGKNEYRMD